MVSFIGETTTDAGLRIRSEIDDGQYPNAVKISDDQNGALAAHSARVS